MWDELKRPATAISIGLFLASVLIGLGTSFYFYKISQKLGRLSYSIDQVKIVDRSHVGNLPFSIVDQTGKRVDGNIFVASIRVWNSGTAEINKESIREQVQLSTPLSP